MRQSQGGRSRSSSSSRSQRSRGGQGFASMSQPERSRIASEGGRERWGYREPEEDDRSYSLRDEDYENYNDYDEIEDETYERGGYGRSSGRGGVGRGYNLSEREYRDYDYDEDQGYHEENVRGRRGLADMDPEEQREIGRRERGRGRQSQTSNRSRSTSSRSARY